MASFVLYNCPQSKINIRSVLGDLSEMEVSLVYRGRPYLENKQTHTRNSLDVGKLDGENERSLELSLKLSYKSESISKKRLF